jgi:xylulose-5-phosphate/fructose-6-phosphate phosphoketolase
VRSCVRGRGWRCSGVRPSWLSESITSTELGPDAGSDPNKPLTERALEDLHAWWRAANYLSVGQIYLMDNPLLREPLRAEQVKPRLLGHWGTTPGLNFIYAHLNRAIMARDLEMMYVMGPGHGGPGPVAASWLEGTYSETYSAIAEYGEGVQRLFKQIPFPGGIPSHVARRPPGRSTRVASWATPCPTRTAPRSTTRPDRRGRG